MVMADAAYFREKAEQCRDLLKVAIVPEVVEQLEIWVREFEERARMAEREGSAL
jgi:hypothetical protein